MQSLLDVIGVIAARPRSCPPRMPSVRFGPNALSLLETRIDATRVHGPKQLTTCICAHWPSTTAAGSSRSTASRAAIVGAQADQLLQLAG